MADVTKSPWIMHYDGSSCNGCDIEVLACLTPLYDIERFGIINTGNPKHADILLITGSVNSQNESVVKQIYEQMTEPKVVQSESVPATAVYSKTATMFWAVLTRLFPLTFMFPAVRQDRNPSLTAL